MKKYATLYHKELEVMSKFMGTTHITRWRYHTNIFYNSAGAGISTYVDWDIFAHLSEYYTPLKRLILFNTLC
jgi:hypothetical protein